MHLVGGWLSTLLPWVAWFVHRIGRRKPGSPLPQYQLFIKGAAMFLVAASVHLGGFLSGVISQAKSARLSKTRKIAILAGHS